MENMEPSTTTAIPQQRVRATTTGTLLRDIFDTAFQASLDTTNQPERPGNISINFKTPVQHMVHYNKSS